MATVAPYWRWLWLAPKAPTARTRWLPLGCWVGRQARQCVLARKGRQSLDRHVLVAALAGLLVLQGCAGLATGRLERRIVLGQRLEAERLSGLQEPPVPQLALDLSHLQVHVQVAAVRRCVAQQFVSQARTEQRWTGFPPWAWTIVAAEAGAGLASSRFGLQASENSASFWPWMAAAALWTGLAAADAWQLATQGQQRQSAPLPPLEEFGSWRLTPCGEEPAPGVEIAVRGGRAAWNTSVGLSGAATIAVDQLPARSFPYQRPFAEVTCAGCASAELTLEAEAAADLVLQRLDLEDLETWLVLHPGHALGQRVASARQQVIQAQRLDREQARRAAELALSQDDLASAGQAVRRCQDAARSPAPLCDELGRRVEDRFVAIQLDQGKRALARGAAGEAEAAHYRCTLVERLRPACQELQRLIAEHREQLLEQQMELAARSVRARDAGLWLAVRHQCRRASKRACRAATERCLASSPEHALCRANLGKMDRRKSAK